MNTSRIKFSLPLFLVISLGLNAPVSVSAQTKAERLCTESFQKAYRGKERQAIKMAVTQCRDLAKTNNAVGQYHIGRMFLVGLGLDENHKTAAGWFARAAKQKHPEAITHLAQMIFKGQGLKRNPSLAVKYFRTAANRGSGLAQYELANRYYRGEGVEKNYVEAYKWFSVSIKTNLEQGNVPRSKLSQRKRDNTVKKLNSKQKKFGDDWLEKRAAKKGG